MISLRSTTINLLTLSLTLFGLTGMSARSNCFLIQSSSAGVSEGDDLNISTPGAENTVGANNGDSPEASSTNKGIARTHLIETYAQLPLSFEANEGQTDTQVRFISRVGAYTLFLTANEAVLAFKKPLPESNAQLIASNTTQYHKSAGNLSSNYHADSKQTSAVRIRLEGANGSPNIEGIEQAYSKSNYFVGNDPKKWHTNIPNYSKVKYRNVYNGVDMIYYGNQRQLEYDFQVAPGINPGIIKLSYKGVSKIRIDNSGDLVLETPYGQIRQHKPFAYQEVNGMKKKVSADYIIDAKRRIGFKLGRYDTTRRLVIDPVLSYSTYLGGTNFDNGEGIAVDSSGNAYVTGVTTSMNFPTTSKAFQPGYGGDTFTFQGDAFVAKLNASGTALIYATYLGGNSGDNGFDIKVDSAGNAYVVGATTSPDFPTTLGAFQQQLALANGATSGRDVFVTKLNPTGSSLIYSTYLGGTGDDGFFGQAIAIDQPGNAYVIGSTNSVDFPITPGAFQPVKPMGPCVDGSCHQDAFITKLNTTGASLVYSTYLGGSGSDALLGYGIALDSAGNVYVTGSTESADFPTTPGAFQSSSAGALGGDAFVTKLNAAGTALVYSTYLGGSDNRDLGLDIAVDSSGNAYVIGETSSADFPTTPGAFQTAQTGISDFRDAFVTKLNSAGSALVYSTYLGGQSLDQGTGIAIDQSGAAYVTGLTGSTDFPTTSNAIQTELLGLSTTDVFVTKLNATGSALEFSTYLGGTGIEVGLDITLDSPGNVYLTGRTSSSNFPITPGAFQATNNGFFDAFISKIGGLASFDLCIQDDSNGNILRLNYSGEYEFIECATTFIVAGSGNLTRKGNVITLQHYAADRRLVVRIDSSANRGTASIQMLSQGRTLTIVDRNVNNNTCSCAPK
jgi:hypothetical protein